MTVGAGAIIKTMPAKRSNPKTMHRAGELRRESIPAERKPWSILQGNKLNGVSFRRQHAIGNYILASFRSKRNSSLSWMELPEAASSRHRALGDMSHRISISNKPKTIKNEPGI